MWITSDADYHVLANRLAKRYGGRGIRIDYLPEVDSTNTWIKAACAQAASSRVVVAFTRHQTAGRGTRGREWRQAAGRDAAVSCGVVLAAGAQVDPRLSLAVGGCLAAVIDDFTGCPVRVKWPNDLLLSQAAPDGAVTRRKFAGILLETAAATDGQRVLVAGVGVNVNSGPADWPGELAQQATALSQALTGPVDVAGLTERLAAALIDVLPSAELTGGLAEWFRRDSTEGTRYLLNRGGLSRPVVARRVDRHSGSLVVVDTAGTEHEVASYSELASPQGPPAGDDC